MWTAAFCWSRVEWQLLLYIAAKLIYEALAYLFLALCVLPSDSMCRAFAVPPEAAAGGDAPYKRVIDALGESSKWQDVLLLLNDMRELDPVAVLNAKTFAAAINACGQTGKWLQASLLLSQASEDRIQLDSSMCTAAISACVSGQQWQRVLQLHEDARSSDVSLTEESSLLVLEACAEEHAWEKALQIFSQAADDDADSILFATVEACSRAQRWAEVLHLQASASSPAPRAELHGAALRTCATSMQWAHALRLLREMEALSLPLTPADFAPAMQTLATTQAEAQPERTPQQTSHLRALHVRLAKLRRRLPESPDPDRRLSLLKPIYVRAADVDEPTSDPAEQVGLQGPSPSPEAQVLEGQRLRTNQPYMQPVDGNVSRHDKWQIALALFQRLEVQKIRLETATFSGAITACARAQQLAHASSLLVMVQGQGLKPDTMTFDALIGGCCRRGLWQQALLLLDRAKEVGMAAFSTYEEALQACSRGRQPKLAMFLLAEMDQPNGSGQGGDEEQSWVTTRAVNAGISACAKCGLWWQALAVMEELRKRDLEPSSATFALAADAAARAADSDVWEHAILLLEECQQSGAEVSSEVYASVVKACSRNGPARWHLALAAVAEMLQLRLSPLASTYKDLLVACHQAGQGALAVKVLEAPLQDLMMAD